MEEAFSFEGDDIHNGINMDMPQENMDISLASSRHTNTGSVHQQNIRKGYLDYPPQRRVGDRRRHVKIRNPRCITPGAPRNPVSYAHHHYTGNNQYQPSVQQRPIIENVNQEASATPRRGPWRYMEVVGFPHNIPSQNNHNIFHANTTSEDTLSDEFEESEVDMGVTTGRSNVVRLQQQEGQCDPFIPHRYINAGDMKRFPTTSSPYHQTKTAITGFTKNARDVHHQPIATRQILPPSSHNRSVNRNFSPTRPMIRSSPNSGADVFTNISSTRHPRNYLQSTLINDPRRISAESLEPSSILDEDSDSQRKTNQQIHRYSSNNFALSPSKAFSKAQRVQSNSPTRKLVANVHHSPRIESMRKPKEVIADYNDGVANILEGNSVSPWTPTSPRRNSTPFLNRPRTLFQDGHAIAGTLDIPANEFSPGPMQAKTQKTKMSLGSSRQSSQVSAAVESNMQMPLLKSPHRALYEIHDLGTNKAPLYSNSDIEDNLGSTDNANLDTLTNKNTRNDAIEDTQIISQKSYHEERPPEIEIEQEPPSTKFSSTVTKYSIVKGSKSTGAQREIASLLASNSFYGILNNQELCSRGEHNTRQGKRCASLRSTDNISNASIIDGSDKSPLHPLKNIRQKITRNKKYLDTSSEMSETENEKCENVPRKEQQRADKHHSTMSNAVFKVPLPPTTLAKTKTNREKVDSFNNTNSDKCSSTADPKGEGATLKQTDELYLKNWTPKLKGKKLLIEGDLLDFGYV